ncbi:MAG: cysteine desulfurase [Segetibacter sp.]|nr:cysteine desulfurase [Segetibacter sp.]
MENKRIYFDNAATTPLDRDVFDAMTPYMLEHYGNPSSIHSFGREARAAIERSRKTVAGLLNTSPSEIFFTSGGTEADNTAIQSTVKTLGLKSIITSKLEHHAVLHTVESLEKEGSAKVNYVEMDEKGNLNLLQLRQTLERHPHSLISLMHGNNEIGNLNDIEEIGEIAAYYGAVFHCDTVQTMGKYKYDLAKLKAGFIVGSAHKFHGPKGVGFIYINNAVKIHPFIHGGAQERNMRGGTENIYGIVGLAKALENAYAKREEIQKHIFGLKTRMIERIKDKLPFAGFNGECVNPEKSLYNIINVSLPESEVNEMLLFKLDIQKISASGGSACSSGSNIGSHVLTALNFNHNLGAIRFSFSKYNTIEEVDFVVDTLAKIYGKVEV